jgi:hypothetical protein
LQLQLKPCAHSYFKSSKLRPTEVVEQLELAYSGACKHCRERPNRRNFLKEYYFRRLTIVAGILGNQKMLQTLMALTPIHLLPPHQLQIEEGS